MLRLLTIHEAVPGHYLQGVYANRCPSIARALFGSGVFAEGWAVYVTQVMMDAGYGADDPAMPPDQLHIDLGERVAVRVAGTDQAVVHPGDDDDQDDDGQEYPACDECDDDAR